MAEDEPAGAPEEDEGAGDADSQGERAPPASATPGAGDAGPEDEAADSTEEVEESKSPVDAATEASVDDADAGTDASKESVEDGAALDEDDETAMDDPSREERTISVEQLSPQVSVLPPERRVTAPIGAVMQANKAEHEPAGDGVPPDVQKYQRFKKVDGAQYERVNEFLRERTYVTAREWAIARLCSDFRTETGIEMTKIGENLPHLVPFMTDTYSPQAVNQARSSFETKVRKSGATFLYGAMSDFFTADELDDIMYEVTEVAKFLLEVEGVDLAVDEELEGEERISSVMREVRSASDELRHDGTTCPNCGHEFGGGHE